MANKRINELPIGTVQSDTVFPIDGSNGTACLNVSSFVSSIVDYTTYNIINNYSAAAGTFIGSITENNTSFSNRQLILEDYFSLQNDHTYLIDVRLRSYYASATAPTINNEHILSSCLTTWWKGNAISGSDPLDYFYTFTYNGKNSGIKIDNKNAAVAVNIRCWDITIGIIDYQPFMGTIQNHAFANISSITEKTTETGSKEYVIGYADSNRLNNVFSTNSVHFVGSNAFRRNVLLETFELNTEMESMQNDNMISSFCECTSLRTASFPNIHTIVISSSNVFDSTFVSCYNLEKVLFDNLSAIYGGWQYVLPPFRNAFKDCDGSKLSIYFPKLHSEKYSSQWNCPSGTHIIFKNQTKIVE